MHGDGLQSRLHTRKNYACPLNEGRAISSLACHRLIEELCCFDKSLKHSSNLKLKLEVIFRSDKGRRVCVPRLNMEYVPHSSLVERSLCVERLCMYSVLCVRVCLQVRAQSFVTALKAHNWPQYQCSFELMISF